ncbi:MAG: GntR family transcriptional regulator [Spirochaetales bacterium]|jgi:DNA-binding GntR family transcriptional regulator|nr:GntR family transcriptional regulator [Spirochaetales bacterium]
MQKTSEPTILLERSSLADQVFIHIKRMILAQELKGGESIPEDKIAKTFGVSRTPIRECLRRLERYGLVKINPRSYATVTEVGSEEARYIGEVRSELETLAARNLAKKSTPDDINRLRELTSTCISYIENGDRGEAFETDGVFHLEIAKRCGNPYVYNILKTLDAKIQLIRIINCTNCAIIHSDIEIHFQIIEAIENHDTKSASSLMRRHIGNFVDHTSPAEGE